MREMGNYMMKCVCDLSATSNTKNVKPCYHISDNYLRDNKVAKPAPVGDTKDPATPGGDAVRVAGVPGLGGGRGLRARGGAPPPAAF